MRINLVLKGSQVYLCRTMRGLVVPVFIILDPGLPSVEILDAEGVLAPKFLELTPQVRAHEYVDEFRRLGGNKTDAELATYFRWNDRFGPWAVKCAFDAMERKRRVTHAPH
jgi:hypothetical protein